MIDSCEGCRFAVEGRCRRFPQQVVDHRFYSDGCRDAEAEWEFPPATHQCGEFQPDVSKCENVLDIANLVFRKRDPE